MLTAHLAGVLAKYNIYLHPNGTIKIDGDPVSIAFAHFAPGSGLQPPTVIKVGIRDRARDYVNAIKTIKEVCKEHDIPCDAVSKRLTI